MSAKLWVEEYRSQTLDSYVWRDADQRAQVERWIADGALPHILLSGVSGTGKTTLAKLMLRALKIPDGDILEINASRERNAETVQTKIVNFVSTWALNDSGFKYVLLDEADRMSPLAQDILRGEMERFHDSARFVLTCVTGDTRVYLANGSKPARRMLRHDRVRTGAGGQSLPNREVRVSQTKRLVRLTTLHGFHLTVTPEHRVLTRGQDEARWVRADALQPGDGVVAALGDVLGNDIDLDTGPAAEATEFDAFCIQAGHAPHEARRVAQTRGWFIKPSCYEELCAIAEEGQTRFSVGYLASRIKVPATVCKRLLGQARRTSTVRDLGDDLWEADWGSFARHLESNWRDMAARFGLPCTTYGEFYWLVVEPKGRESLEGIQAGVGGVLATNAHRDTLAAVGRLTGFLVAAGGVSKRGVVFRHTNSNVLQAVVDDLRDAFPALAERPQITGPADDLTVVVADPAFGLLMRFLLGPADRVPDACWRSTALGHGFAQAMFGLLMPRLGPENPFPSLPAPPHLDAATAVEFVCEMQSFLADRLEVPTVLSDTALLITTEAATLTFLERLATAYADRCPEMFGYLRFRAHGGDPNLTFDGWVETFDWEGNTIEDRIVGIEAVEEACEVYDCCLDAVHSYVTNGLVSHNCNYPQRITPAIHSRVQGFDFKALDTEQFYARVIDILAAERVSYETDVLVAYVERTYPDLRKTINLLQQNAMPTPDGLRLKPPRDEDQSTKDYLIEAATLFQTGRLLEARKLIVSQAQEEEYPDIFRYLYQHLDLWGDTQDQQDDALLVVRRGMVNNHWAADKEINLSATLVELARVRSA